MWCSGFFSGCVKFISFPLFDVNDLFFFFVTVISWGPGRYKFERMWPDSSGLKWKDYMLKNPLVIHAVVNLHCSSPLPRTVHQSSGNANTRGTWVFHVTAFYADEARSGRFSVRRLASLDICCSPLHARNLIVYNVTFAFCDVLQDYSRCGLGC